MGAVALPPFEATQAGPGPGDVLWFGLIPSPPHCLVSPPPASTPPMPRCLTEQPRTERLLAIRGGSQGPDGRAQEASARCWWPLVWVVSSQAESLIYLVQKL